MIKFDLKDDPMLCSGHAACPGCIEALSVRHILATMGPDTMAVIPPSCMAIIAGPQPMSSLKIPVYQPTLESSAAAATGLRRALDAQGKRDTQVLVLAGDGGTYDIGFQCLSSAAERNENILYFCLDNEGYMNTGAQKSSSTPHYARTGSTPAGKSTRKKNLTEIMAAHRVPYAATASIGHPGSGGGPASRRSTAAHTIHAAAASRVRPFRPAPTMLARVQPKVAWWSDARCARRAASRATTRPPTSETMWTASDRRARLPVHQAVAASTPKNARFSHRAAPRACSV